MQKFFLALLIFVFTSDPGAYAANKINPASTKEEMMEDVLFQHYASHLLKITNRLYDCKKILSIERFDNKHLIRVGLTTFTGPHNPPNDLYIITFMDSPSGPEQPFDFHLENVDQVENISNEQYEAFCRK
ncbi:hypothetical protein [Neobacillus sp. D3-1R]|uniref:hypothetical protein n=1 Tax=Neobacillus sp. D3-1R TaxID=3445778 RepID=UPI003FA0367F